MSAVYDSIGINYAELRKPDPRIAKTIEQALGAAKVILNVGAGTGSYEPADRQLVAVEPSLEMIRQRRSSAARAIQASADNLPQLATLDETHSPQMSDYARWLGNVRTSPVLVPHDCTDGFLYAYWRRPSAYLDARIRLGSWSFR